MTQPVDQALLKAEMETLAKVYVQIQAFAIDSLVYRPDKPELWHGVHTACREASEDIGKAIGDLVGAYCHLDKIP